MKSLFALNLDLRVELDGAAQSWNWRINGRGSSYNDGWKKTRSISRWWERRRYRAKEGDNRDWAARNQKSTASMSAIAEANLGKFNHTQHEHDGRECELTPPQCINECILFVILWTTPLCTLYTLYTSPCHFASSCDWQTTKMENSRQQSDTRYSHSSNTTTSAW